MPLRARFNGKDVFAFEFAKDDWDEFKSSSKGEPLLMPCCDSRAIPKTSKLGNHFFSHKTKGDCSSEAESQEHLFIKGVIACAAKEAGWNVTTEWPGETPHGEKWVADVLCTRGNAKVVLEVQLSKQSPGEVRARQRRYKESGLRCAWFASERTFKKAPHLANYIHSSKDIPFFRIAAPVVGVDPMVDEFDFPLSKFVVELLNGNVTWKEEPIVEDGLIHYVDDTCWKCGEPNKQVCGHSFDWYSKIVKTVPNASTVLKDMLDNVITNPELSSLGLNTIASADDLKGNAPGFPYCNHCQHCGAPQNNYYLMQKIGSPVFEEDTLRFKSMEYGRSAGSSGSWVYEVK